MFAIFVVREEDDVAVSLVTAILAVREVVADQLGVNTGSVLTTEISRLINLSVKVEVDLSTTFVLKIPFVLSQGI